MFGAGYFGRGYFGAGYFGPAAGSAPQPPPEPRDGAVDWWWAQQRAPWSVPFEGNAYGTTIGVHVLFIAGNAVGSTQTPGVRQRLVASVRAGDCASEITVLGGHGSLLAYLDAGRATGAAQAEGVRVTLNLAMKQGCGHVMGATAGAVMTVRATVSFGEASVR